MTEPNLEPEAFSLRIATPPEWVAIALGNFDAFLQDHAGCERKASAIGLSFVVKYPDRTALIGPMIQFAREELEHFHQVYRLLEARGLRLCNDTRNVYVNRLLEHVRTGRDERLLDRLVATSILEARGHERLTLVAEALEEPTLKSFYSRLARAEGHHKSLFLTLAKLYAPEKEVNERLDFLLDAEAKAIQSVPFRPAIH